jgi:hypothetical protein
MNNLYVQLLGHILSKNMSKTFWDFPGKKL